MFAGVEVGRKGADWTRLRWEDIPGDGRAVEGPQCFLCEEPGKVRCSKCRTRCVLPPSFVRWGIWKAGCFEFTQVLWTGKAIDALIVENADVRGFAGLPARRLEEEPQE